MKIKVVIMAGGKGTRIASVSNGLPKPLIPIGGKPILEHELVCLRDQGFDDFLITVGYLGQKIIDFFGDGSRWGIHIEYFLEEKPLGSAGALFKIKSKLSDTFLLLNADSMFDVDFKRLLSFHFEKGGLATLLAHPNSHPYDSGLLLVNSNGQILQWLAREDVRPQWYKNLVNAGIHVLSLKALNLIEPKTEKIDLDRDVLRPLCAAGQLFAYFSTEYVKDMGTPERLASVVNDFEKGIVRARNLRNKQKAIFLDRDGTINRYVGFLTNIDEFVLIAGVAESIKLINESGYLAIVVTNQPVIARGEVTFEELDLIHKKMETLLGKQGAYIDGLYFCPHHPDKGFPGERAELKVICDCRKPKPGMLLKAAKDFNIDLSQSWVIGDRLADVEAGKAAGCKTILLGDSPDDKRGFAIETNLPQAIKRIMGLK